MDTSNTKVALARIRVRVCLFINKMDQNKNKIRNKGLRSTKFCNRRKSEPIENHLESIFIEPADEQVFEAKFTKTSLEKQVKQGYK